MSAYSLNGNQSITVLENAGTHALFQNYDFLYSGGTLGGVSLNISGLLAEDRLRLIADGHITLDQSQVFYDGALVAFAGGGQGDAFHLVFLSSATETIAQALIQHIGYATTSDTPTPSRDLTFSLTDQNGAAVGQLSHPSFTELTGAASPFNGLNTPDVTDIVFADLDHDGDLDMFPFGFSSTTPLPDFYRNEGTAAAPEFQPRSFSAPAGHTLLGGIISDLDHDGDLDALGISQNQLLYAPNTGGVTDPAYNFVDSLYNFSNAAIIADGGGGVVSFTGGDIDGDGDIDIVVGRQHGLNFLRNEGSITNPSYVLEGTESPVFGLIQHEPQAALPALADIDGDGDLDLVVIRPPFFFNGQLDERIDYYRNEGTKPDPHFVLQTAADNPFAGINVPGNVATPTFADLDHDGDLDMVIVDGNNALHYFVNNTTTGTPATFTINVTAQNDAPVAQDSAASGSEDFFFNGHVSASDPDGNALTYSIVDGAAHGTVSLGQDGFFGYLVDPNYTGSDSFTYKVNDGTLDSNTATVNLTVNPVNDAPTVSLDGGPEIVTANNDGSVSIFVPDGHGGFAARSLDLADDALVGLGLGTVFVRGDPAAMQIVVASNFQVLIRELGPQGQLIGAGGTGLGVEIQAFAVADVNHNGVSDFIAATTGNGIVVDVDAFRGGSIVGPIPVGGTDTVAIALGDLDGDGNLDIATANRGSDNVSVLLGDGAGNFAAATTFSVGVGSAPASVALGDVNGDGLLDIVTANKGTDEVGILLGDGQGGFTVSSAPIGGSGPAAVALGDVNGDGNLDIVTANAGSNDVDLLLGDGRGDFTASTRAIAGGLDPESITLGDVDSDGNFDIVTGNRGSNDVSLLMGDGHGGFTASTMSTGAHAPTAVVLGHVQDSAQVAREDTAFVFSDANGNAITIRDVDGGGGVETVTLHADHGTLTIAPSSGVTVIGNTSDSSSITFAGTLAQLNAALDGLIYTPGHDYNGRDTLTLTVNDGGNSGSGGARITTRTILIDVTPVNDAPVAQDGAASGTEDTQINGAVSASDVDTAVAALRYGVVAQAAHGTVDLQSDGHFIYTSNADYSGLDSFTFKANDGSLDSYVTTVNLTINPVNDAPVAQDGASSGNSGHDIIDTLAATDIDSPTLTYSSVTQGRHGSVTVKSNGTYIYTPDAGFSGTDSFTYKASDGSLDSNVATVGITINTQSPPLNQAPVNTLPGRQEIDANTNTAIVGLFITDADAGSGAMTTSLSVAHGTLTIASAGGAAVFGSGTAAVLLTGTLAQINATLTASNNVVYRGARDYFGNDTLTVATNDGSNTGTGGPLTDTDALTIHLNTHLTGTPGNDSFTALSGNERIDAGTGVDTITFGFKLADATVTWSGNTVTIDGPVSHTVLSGFETYVFVDGTVTNADGSPLIDDLFYYSQYHDVWNAHVDADLHYNQSGWHEGRNPDAWFNTKFYLSVYSDVKAAGINPLSEFDQTGWKQGRDPSLGFDTSKYLAANPDVAAAHVDPLAHFLQYGAQEGRQPFAVTELLASNGFDFAYYLQHNPDVAAAGVDPYQHFETTGWKEGRNPNALFDTNGYLFTYGDVKAAGINPLDHYHQNGWTEGRDPSKGFDTTDYLGHYPDVAAAHIDPLKHFLQNGFQEHRSAFADGSWG